MRRRLPPSFRAVAIVALAFGTTACGDDDADPGDDRAEQVRAAAAEAGLDEEVAEFLGLAARGQTATYQASYPGPDEGSELVVANEPPNRRVDVVVDGDIIEVRLVLDGEAFRCEREADGDAISSCTRTDAIVEAPGSFDERSLSRLTESLEERSDDFTFRVETAPVAGVEARCLVTEIREGRSRPELGSIGTICVSAEGALLKVDQDGESLEAEEYTTQIPENTFERPDQQD